MECRHTASNTHKISLGNQKRVSFFSACFSYAYFFYQVILSPGNRKRSPCATIKKERGLAAPVSWKSPKVLANGRTLSESELPVTTSAQQAVQPQQTANPYQADPQTAYAVPEMEPEQTPIDYGQFATSTNYPHTYDVEDSSDVDMDALSGFASDVFDKQPRKKLSRKERKAQAKEMKKLQKESNAKLKANAKSNKSIQKQLKDRDKELSKKNEFARYRRKTAKDVTSFIG